MAFNAALASIKLAKKTHEWTQGNNAMNDLIIYDAQLYLVTMQGYKARKENLPRKSPFGDWPKSSERRKEAWLEGWDKADKE